MTTSRARGFTLLELMLALALASIVALSAYGLFEIIRRSERRQYVRMGETDEIARTYRTLERVFRTLVMTDRAKPGNEKALEERMRNFELAVDNDEPDPPLDRDEPEPRLILRPDPSSPYLDVEIDGRRTRMKAQVLEVVLRSPPVLGAQPDSRIFERGYLAGRRETERASRNRRDRERDRESRASGTDSAGERDDAEDREPPLLAPGVRGVFELIPDGVDPLGALGPSAGLEGWRPRESTGLGLTLWWRELPPPLEDENDDDGADIVDADGNPVAAADDDAPARRSRDELEAEQLLRLASARRVPLITGLRWAKWEVFRAKRFDIRTRATWYEELPGYVKVAFQTVEGRRENWMFEIGWSTGPEPGTKIDRATLPSAVPPALQPGQNNNNRDSNNRENDRTDRPASRRGRNGSNDGGSGK